ncbi:hypothetical protein Sjap_008069 [Stephania japonica]|uniref:Uncharacterized protein n=1 Tax=Stephania japonica TaxID=461633 RepID=A0AAP0JR16_9MAGN
MWSTLQEEATTSSGQNSSSGILPPELEFCLQTQVMHYLSAVEQGKDADTRIGTLVGQINASFDNLINEEEFLVAVPCGLKENASAITLRGVEEDEYWFESEDELEILPLRLNIMTVEVHKEKVKEKIEVTLERPEELEEESKEDQLLVSLKPPTLPCILVELETGVKEKGHLKVLCTNSTFMLDDHDKT